MSYNSTLNKETKTMSTMTQAQYAILVKDACKLEGITKPSPEDLMFSGMFGTSSEVKIYKEFLVKLHEEMKKSGISAVVDAQGTPYNWY